MGRYDKILLNLLENDLWHFQLKKGSNHPGFFDQKDIYFLEKQFSFKNFLDSQKFVNAVGKISEEEGHHPEITFGWGYAKINITTHAIEGLSENDFILAAKIDKI